MVMPASPPNTWARSMPRPCVSLSKRYLREARTPSSDAGGGTGSETTAVRASEWEKDSPQSGVR